MKPPSAVAIAIVFGVWLLILLPPWGFFMGGGFRLYPRWQGFGRLHSSTAGDFVLFVSFVPARPTRRSGPRVAGTAILCTPRGERFDLLLGGEFERHLGIDFQGRTVELHMRNSSFIDWQLGKDLRPKIQLTGRWNNPDLVMDDGGTLARGFEPDGSIYRGNFKNRPPGRETVKVILHEASRSDFDAACAAASTGFRR